MAVRLNKYLADRGVGARRKCDDLIAQGRVSVNGERVTEAGTKVEEGRDRVQVDGKPIAGKAAHVYYIINKPVGVITTMDDPHGRRTIAQFLPRGARVYPVGRLDADTSGLLLLTNDGELAHKLMHPRYGVQKVYRVRLAEEPRGDQLRRLASGVRFDKGLVSGPARVRRIDPGFDAIMIELIIHEGRFRQVRKMCEAVGLQVTGLHRVGYGPLRMGPLARGMFRELSEEEVAQLRAAGARPGGLLRGEREPGVRAERPSAPARPGATPARKPKPAPAPAPVDEDDEDDVEVEETWVAGGGLLSRDEHDADDDSFAAVSDSGEGGPEDGWPEDEARAPAQARDADDDDEDDEDDAYEEDDETSDGEPEGAESPVSQWPARPTRARGDAAWLAEQGSAGRSVPRTGRAPAKVEKKPRAASPGRPAPRVRADERRPAAPARSERPARTGAGRGFGSRLDRPKRDPFAPHEPRGPRVARPAKPARDGRPARGSGKPERGGFVSVPRHLDRSGFAGPPPRGDAPRGKGRPVRGGFAGRPERAGFDDRPARAGGRPERGGFAGRPERAGFQDRPARAGGRPERGGFAGRPERGGFQERPARAGGRPERGGFAGRPERGGFQDRPARAGGRPERGGLAGRPERGGFQDRPARAGGRSERGGFGGRPERRGPAESFGPQKGRARKAERAGFTPRGGGGRFGAEPDDRPTRRGAGRPGASPSRSSARSSRPGASPGSRPVSRPGSRTGPRPSGKPKRGLGDSTQAFGGRGRNAPGGRPGRPGARPAGRGGAPPRGSAGKKTSRGKRF